MNKKSVDSLGRAMKKVSRRNDNWKYKVDNKMRGDYGETDYEKKVIRVNKAISKRKPMFKHPLGKRPGKYPDILGTIVHELHHKSHPEATEQQTLKHERKTVGKLSPKQKKRLYSKFA